MKKIIIILTLLLGVMSYGQGNLADTFVYDYGDRFTTRQTAQLDCGNQDRQYRLFLLEDNNNNLHIRVNGASGPTETFNNYYKVVDGPGYSRQELIDRINLNKDNFNSFELSQMPRSFNADYWDYDHNLVDPPCSDRRFRANQTPSRYLQYKEGYTGRNGSRFNYGPRGDVYIDVGSNFTVRFGATEWTETYAHRAYDRLRQAYAHETWEQDLIARGFVDSPDSAYQWEKRCPSGIVIRVQHTGNGLYRVQNDGTGTLNLSFQDVLNTITDFCS